MTFVLYLAVQVLAYGVDIGVFLLLTGAGIAGPIPANIGGKLLAGTLAFAAHRHFTFQAGAPADRNHQALRYLILLTANLPLSSGVLAAVLACLDEVMIAKVVADALCVALTYYLSKSFVFVTRGKAIAEADRARGSRV